MAGARSQEPPVNTVRVKPPRSVTFLSLGVLTITGFYAVRAVLALLRWDELAQLPGVLPGYIAGMSLFWAFTAAGLWWGLCRRESWAPPLTRLAAVTYSGFSWLEPLVVAAYTENSFFGLQWSHALPVNWLFMLLLYLAGILFVFWTLSRKQVKELFGELHERKP